LHTLLWSCWLASWEEDKAVRLREYGDGVDHCGRHGSLIGRGDDGFHGVGKAEVLELLLTVWSLLLLNSGNQSKG